MSRASGARPEPASKWPDFADRSWGSSIHTYYGDTPYWLS